ncbi:MAG: hypothetical protein K0S58_2946 [Nitrospira sp.]|nr:hypothetical protein [Nitrospira sp.]
MLFGKVRSAVRPEDDCARVVREVRAAFGQLSAGAFVRFLCPQRGNALRGQERTDQGEFQGRCARSPHAKNRGSQEKIRFSQDRLSATIWLREQMKVADESYGRHIGIESRSPQVSSR